jgi:hypothetical protein
MIREIETHIRTGVEKFLEQTAKEFDLPIIRLKENWRAYLESEDAAVPAASAAVEVVKKKAVSGKKSMYQNFFTQKCSELKEQNPGMNFGDISTTVSKLWNSMSKDDQKQYATADTTSTVEAPTTTTTEFTYDVLNGKKMDELKLLCEQRGLRRTGNKTFLIRSLLGSHPPVAEDPPPPPKKAALSLHEDDVEVVVAKNLKRTDIEEDTMLSGVVSDEEQEFDFGEEEDDTYSVALEEDD